MDKVFDAAIPQGAILGPGIILNISCSTYNTRNICSQPEVNGSSLDSYSGPDKERSITLGM